MGELFKTNDELSMKERLVKLLSEFLGTMILVFLGCGSCASGIAPGSLSHLNICLGFGLGAMIAVQICGHISGSHINPIVTMSSVLLGNLAMVEIPFYFIGQFLGAFVGYGLVMAATPEEYQMHTKREIAPNGSFISVTISGICSPVVNPEIMPIQGMLIEFLCSLWLVLLCCGVWDIRNAQRHDSVPIKFGLAIAVLALVGGPYSGANMNPARSLAPAAWHGDWDNHWVYWVGPFLAAIVGSLSYRFIFAQEPEEEL